ncbi:hypothetical protein DCC79_13005 [bacterium]|nr:hypothetical protein [Chloroflexi bacterium CFX6]RIL08746.1 MAG: hypothetical protein DCC79_13005 [bacterium]
MTSELPKAGAARRARRGPTVDDAVRQAAPRPRMNPDLASAMDADPESRMQAIVFAQDGLDDLLAHLPPEVHVEHTYSLIGSVCVSGSVADLRRLADMPTVKSIEPVRTVTHW